MFCDLVGSTLLAEQLEPEDWSAVLMRFRQACKGMAEQFGGYVAQHLGDGALVYFGYPRAGEDDAIRAGSAALDLIDVLARTAQRPLLSVRIGIATGRVLVGQDYAGGALHEGGAVGSTPNRAQRLQALARPGEVIVDQATHRLIKQRFQITGLGAVELKGFDEPVGCHRIDAVLAAEPQPSMRSEARSPLVGRLGQIEQLHSAWRSTDPPPLNWSTLKYVLWQRGGSCSCRESVTNPKRSSRSCGRSMSWFRRANPSPMRFAILA